MTSLDKSKNEKSKDIPRHWLQFCDSDTDIT